MVSDLFLRTGYRNSMLLLEIPVCIGAGILIAGNHWVPAVILILTGLIIVSTLIAVYNVTNKSITAFFDSLRNDDPTLRFERPKGNKTLGRLYDRMNDLNRHFEEIRLRNEFNESYYRTLIEHASTGLVVLNSNNSIELINKAACNYAGISPDSTNRDLLKIKHPSFYKAISDLKPGDTVMYKHLASNNLTILFFRATGLFRKDEKLKLVSIQDIRSELETKELESYRKLMSVMTHEIMNILSPITSVSKELYSLFSRINESGESPVLSSSDTRTAVSGIKLINEQSNSLVNFVSSYRKISRIPQPEFTEFSTADWVAQLQIAYIERMRENNIDLSIGTDKSVQTIIADRNLLNQVMINLINNAVDSLLEIKDNRSLAIRIMKKNQDRTLITVTDNGPGIPPEMIDKIFVPFFTTKKNGSGIGLSISQEIMKLHNGSITVVSPEDGVTSFLVEF